MLVTFGIRPIDPVTGLLGHADAPGMAVVALSDDLNEDGRPQSGFLPGTDAVTVRDHLFVRQGSSVAHLPGNEAILDVYQSLRLHLAGGDQPDWVAVDPQRRDPETAADFERFLADFYHCPAGMPADVEDTHHTLHGSRVYPPGERPEG